MASSAEGKRLTLATLLSPITESEMPYAGDVLHLRWRLGKLTPQFQARASADAGDPVKDAAHLAELLVSWDLEGDDGKPYPVTAKALADLPVGFLNAVTQFLVTAVLPKAQSEAVSGGSSEPEEI